MNMDTRTLYTDLMISATFGEDDGDNRTEQVLEITASDGAETVAYATSQQDADELVARWNAYPTLKAQRDELLKWMRGFIDYADGKVGPGGFVDQVEAARAMIANATK